MRPRVAVAVPESLRALFFTEETWTRLESLAQVKVIEGDHRSADVFRDLVSDCSVVVTAWANPPLTRDILDAAPDLRLMAHTAASVKQYVTPDSWARGVRVTQAGQAMAPAVAEAALAHTLALLHRLHRYDHALRADKADWPTAKTAPPRRELSCSVVGVVGASRTGRSYIGMVRALGAQVLVYDPYLSEADASALGVESVSLDSLMSRSRVVAVHAPVTPETHHLIGARELALMPDEAVLVNTARSWLVDQDALLAELKSGRIDAGLDVFDEEPLPSDHPYRSLPNVLLVPHEAGGTLDARWRGGDIVVSELAHWIAGEPLEHEVTADMLDRMG
ncbi:MAG TPA: hydroxyacid dehydrogenase [Actinopolymorphaceae bacterium]